MLYGLR